MGDLTSLASRLARGLDLAKISRERVLLFPGQHLTRKDDDVVVKKRLQDSQLRCWRQRLRQIDPGNRDPARCRQGRLYSDLHRPSPAPPRVACRSKIGAAAVEFPIPMAGRLRALRTADLSRQSVGRRLVCRGLDRLWPFAVARSIVHDGNMDHKGHGLNRLAVPGLITTSGTKPAAGC